MDILKPFPFLSALLLLVALGAPQRAAACSGCALPDVSTRIAVETLLTRWETLETRLTQDADAVRASEHQLEPKVLVTARLRSALTKLQEGDRITFESLNTMLGKSKDQNGLVGDAIIAASHTQEKQ